MRKSTFTDKSTALSKSKPLQAATKFSKILMKGPHNYVKRLFRAYGKEVHVLVGSRYTEDAIALADLVAGSARKGAVLARKFGLEDAKRRIEKL